MSNHDKLTAQHAQENVHTSLQPTSLPQFHPSDPPQDSVADALAPIMFWLSICFLALVACVMVLWIDVPRIADAAEELAAAEPHSVGSIQAAVELDPFTLHSIAWGYVVGLLLLALWPLFIMEQLALFCLTASKESFHLRHRYWWAFCLFPPLRMCARHHGSRDRMWLPSLGWQIVNQDLQRQLERAFGLPMIGIALLILPVLALQAVYQDNISNFPVLRAALHIGTGIIWFAFATEFVVMVSVTSHKVDYCRKHWLDLLIILLPLISFLRSLRILRATKLLNISKLQQLSKFVRVYRLRGVALRGWRALLLLELVDRVLHAKPERQIKRLEAKCEQAERELLQLRAQLAARRAQLNSTQLPTQDAQTGPSDP
jgi:hypothetical protein